MANSPLSVLTKAFTNYDDEGHHYYYLSLVGIDIVIESAWIWDLLGLVRFNLSFFFSDYE